MRIKSRVLASLFLISLAAPPVWSAYGQSDSSSLSGGISDASGALLPNAKVTVRNNATGSEVTASTNESGNFTLPNVTAGNYTVKVEAAGFQSVTLNNVNVDPSIGRHIDVAMKVGESTSTVTVEAGANSVQTESAVVGQLVTQEQVKSIQLNGRNPLYLSQLEPGVTRNASMASFAFGLDNGVNIGGARSQESLITIDGAPAVRTRSNGTSVGVADVDSTSQVQILTNSYQAEYGRTDGGQVRIVPKSGTNTFHGAAYEFFRNTILNANTWQRKLPSNSAAIRNKPPGFRYNQYGWNLNGPVYIPKVFNKDKSKLFFLLGQEYLRYNNDDTVFQKVPTALMRTGNFSELLSPNIFYGGVNQIYSPTTGAAYAGNVIPSSDLSANGLALLNAFPAPNASATTYNWVDAATEMQTQRKDTIVMDYIPFEAHHLRFSLLNYNYHDYSPHYGNFNRNPRIFDRPNQVAVVHYAWTISPTMVNELIVSAAADHVTIGIDTSSGLYDRTKYGINYPFLYSAATKTIPNKIPTISLPNFTLLDGGPYPSHSGGVVYNFADNVTKVWGNHTVKIGFNFEYGGENNFDQITVSNTPGSTNNQNGKFTFTDQRAGGTTTKIGVANAAEGLFDTYGEIGQRSYTLYRSTMYEGFLQDQWRATPQLVIEAGARYSFYNPYYAIWGNQSVFNPASYNPANAVTVNPATDVVTGGDRYNGVVIPGSGFPSSAAGHVDPAILAGFQGLFRGFSNAYSPTVKTDIQPRFGITYQPRQGLVIRGGGGRYVQRLGITDNVFTGGNAPFQPSSTVSLGQANAPGGVGSNNFPFNYSSQAYNYPSPESYNWNLTVEQEFPALGVFSMSYAGRRGIHLEELINVNQLPIGTTLLPSSQGVATDALRPYKGFSNINQATNGGASIYNALQMNLRRRLSKGLLFGVAYTWSNSSDFGSSNGTQLPNAFDKSNYWGRSDFNIRHVFVSNFVYNIDQFNHSNHMAERIALGSWQFSGTLQAQTGPPLNVSNGNDFAGVGTGSGTQLYREVSHVQTYKNFAGQTGTAPWFSTASFSQPLPGTFAPRGSRNQINGTGFQNYSFALNKTFHIIPNHDNQTMVFRGEGFNVLNHPTPDNPDTGPTSGTFGLSRTKGGTYGADRQFQFSLRYAF
ncbi:TonB-dependent receptor [Granulicella sibirica]|uniref:TonB-dependent receptor n=1 Tax=Granulicella sibirica TaxID=2479048 RepID=UPI001008EDDA|nr:carboxypeptidase regulatory-like domain-containing protein [Granulicella sibirica]